jgi:hypothetical protein
LDDELAAPDGTVPTPPPAPMPPPAAPAAAASAPPPPVPPRPAATDHPVPPGYAAQPPRPGYTGEPGYATQPANPGYPAQPGYAAQPGYPLYPAQPGYPTAGYAPAYTARREPGSPALGVIALIAGVLALIVGVVLAALAAQAYADFVRYSAGYAGSGIDSSQLPPAAEQSAANAGILALVGIVVWALLALWGLVQGIVAIALRRGRGWGIAAVIAAPVSGVAGFLVYVVSLGAQIAQTAGTLALG